MFETITYNEAHGCWENEFNNVYYSGYTSGTGLFTYTTIIYISKYIIETYVENIYALSHTLEIKNVYGPAMTDKELFLYKLKHANEKVYIEDNVVDLICSFTSSNLSQHDIYRMTMFLKENNFI